MVSFEEVSEEATDSKTEARTLDSSNVSSAAAASATDSVKDRAAWEERLLDAQEIFSVAANVTRPTVRMHLETLGKRLQKESEALKRVEESQSLAESEKKQNINPAVATNAVTTSARSDPPTVPSSVRYVPVDRFAFDAGGYNEAFVTLYVDLAGVGSIPRENVRCDFKVASIDLVVQDLKGKSYRLFKDSLEKDINPEKCKIIVKANKIIVKLAKVKQEYGGYEFWSKLTDSKKSDTKAKKEDPQSSIMNMMKQMYEDGDDNMKKIIGETMMKQQRGELNDKDKPGGGMSGMGLDDRMDDF